MFSRRILYATQTLSVNLFAFSHNFTHNMNPGILVKYFCQCKPGGPPYINTCQQGGGRRQKTQNPVNVVYEGRSLFKNRTDSEFYQISHSIAILHVHLVYLYLVFRDLV